MYHFCTITNRTIISWGLFVYSNFLSTYLYSLLDCNLLMVYWLSLTSLWSHLELVHSRWSIDICKSINKWSEALLGCTQNQYVLKPLKKGHGDIDVNLLLIFVQRICIHTYNWRRKWQPTPVILPGEFHGQRSLAGYSPWGCKESSMTEQLSLILW